jgi:hypothetical protein
MFVIAVSQTTGVSIALLVQDDWLGRLMAKKRNRADINAPNINSGRGCRAVRHNLSFIYKPFRILQGKFKATQNFCVMIRGSQTGKEGEHDQTARDPNPNVHGQKGGNPGRT